MCSFQVLLFLQLSKNQIHHVILQFYDFVLKSNFFNKVLLDKTMEQLHDNTKGYWGNIIVEKGGWKEGSNLVEWCAFSSVWIDVFKDTYILLGYENSCL